VRASSRPSRTGAKWPTPDGAFKEPCGDLGGASAQLALNLLYSGASVALANAPASLPQSSPPCHSSARSTAIDGQHADTPLPHTNYYSVSDNRVDITLDDGGTGSLWWATKNEWLGLLDVAGLRLEALYGGFAGEPLDDDSREYIFVARR
jgi:hypothetical protein